MYAAFMALGFLGLLPVAILASLQMLSILLSVASKSEQIRKIYQVRQPQRLSLTRPRTLRRSLTVPVMQEKSAGMLSLATWSMMTYGTAVRVFTTLIEVHDPLVLLSFSLGLALNSTVVLQARAACRTSCGRPQQSG